MERYCCVAVPHAGHAEELIKIRICKGGQQPARPKPADPQISPGRLWRCESVEESCSSTRLPPCSYQSKQNDVLTGAVAQVPVGSKYALRPKPGIPRQALGPSIVKICC